MFRRVLFFTLLAMLLLALPTGALANKQQYKARLVPIVNDVNTRGSVVLALRPHGVEFQGAVRNNTSPINGIYVVNSADEGGFMISLCDMPDASCEVSDGFFILSGLIRLTPEMGITGPAFVDALQADQLEVVVTTEDNPGGEASGGLR